MPNDHTGGRKPSPIMVDAELPAPLQMIPFFVGAVVWWTVKALIGIGFVAGLTVVLGGSIALGLTIGCALAFIAALGVNE